MKHVLLVFCLAACTNPAPERKDYTVEWVGQRESNWCWAATAAMLGQAYTGVHLDECEIAGMTLDKDCCAAPESCNQSSVASKALQMSFGLNTKEEKFDEAVIGNAPVIVAYWGADSVGHATVVQRHGLEFFRYDPIKLAPYNVARLGSVEKYGDWTARVMVRVE